MGEKSRRIKHYNDYIKLQLHGMLIPKESLLTTDLKNILKDESDIMGIKNTYLLSCQELDEKIDTALMSVSPNAWVSFKCDALDG